MLGETDMHTASFIIHSEPLSHSQSQRRLEIGVTTMTLSVAANSTVRRCTAILDDCAAQRPTTVQPLRAIGDRAPRHCVSFAADR